VAVTTPVVPDGRFDAVFDSQAVFRALLDGMARPGTVRLLPRRDRRCPVGACQRLAASLLTLLDHEVTFAVVPGAGGAGGAGGEDADHRLTNYLVLTTGARVTSAGEADFVVALGPWPPGLPLDLRHGTAAFPDEGATVLALAPDPGLAGDGPTVALAGPGVRPGATARLAGLTRADVTDLAIANGEPPRGVDLILMDPGGRFLCLPRSTRLTPLEDG
jgi:alpha-D-ribose 1-methylphosphonate 5-triphosphate synthase subunit PhnH